MILSMTGYGKKTALFNDKKIHIELKSLNSKALDLSVRIAPLYREKEMEIRTLISQRLERGKIDFSLWIEKDEMALATLINGTVLDSYYKQIQRISIERGIPMPEDCFATLLRMPDVMTKTEIEELSEEEWSIVHQRINDALDDLMGFRTQEGAALEVKLCENISHIEQLLVEVEPLEKERIEKIRARLVAGIEAIPEVKYDSGRLEQELIYYIEKLDINEEKQRLKNHLNYFRETMNATHGQGKKMGFIAQEIGREINTMGSKSNQAEMQQIVVRMKDDLEQIKEQILNVM